MEPKLKLPQVHFKVGLILRRQIKWDNIPYDVFYVLKRKNSNNMWYIERLWSKPEVPKDISDNMDWFHKQYRSKEVILMHLELLGNDIKLKTIKVLFG